MGKSYLTLGLLGICAGCVSAPPWADILSINDHPPDEVQYVSLDRSRVSTFSSGRAALEQPWILKDLAPHGPVSFLEPGPGIQCLSVGPAENAVEYAIKRPIREWEQYQCRRYQFHVEECFDGCKSAVVGFKLIGEPPGERPLSSKILINDCVGVVMFDLYNTTGRMNLFGSPALVGEKGILASSDFPNCISDY